MTNSMNKAWRMLCDRFGAGYGRIRLNWLCQKYDILPPWDECPDEMLQDIESETAQAMKPRRSFF